MDEAPQAAADHELQPVSEMGRNLHKIGASLLLHLQDHLIAPALLVEAEHTAVFSRVNLSFPVSVAGRFAIILQV
ncbi:MAG: hypothetical protein DDT27_00575 [Dehalococcoidia bacterium]|nr:hypothetical protein [Chloroflexota bacterium]